MKLTKKLETEVLKAYNSIWDAYLKGDMRVFASMLDENCHIIGSAAGEVFSNKKSAVKYYKATAAQISGKAEFRNRKISVMPVDKGVMVNEESNFYLLIDEQWTFYGDARISSLFHKKNNKWKVIHQHGSFPDSKTEEGEQINAEKIKAENLQLRDAVKRRTIELEEKNRELEIEAALERVRSKTMAMHQSDELLDVINVVSEQLLQLNFKFDNVSFGVNTPGYDIKFWIAVKGRSYPILCYVPYLDNPVINRLKEAQQNKPGYLFTDILTREENRQWILHLFNNADVNFPQEAINSLLESPGYSRTTIILKDIFIFIGNYAAVPYADDENAIFKRFANVFEQSYTRFLDLQKAEAQAREAKIEAALERVRARSMAMHHSDELHEVADVLFRQLRAFGGNILNAGIALCKTDADEDEYWISSESGIRPLIYIPHTDDPVQKKMYEGWKNKLEFYSESKSGEELKAHYDYMISVPSLKPFFEEGVASNRTFPAWQEWHAAYFSHGYLFMLTAEPYKEEKILVRFAKIFEQAYTRFLDLKRAEAQAREAKIEAGLERVRSRVMAMQTSEELNALIGTVFTELTRLDLMLTRCVIIIYDPTTTGARWWMANSEAPDQPMSFFVKHCALPFFTTYLDGWKERTVKWQYILEGQNKIMTDDFLFSETELSQLPDFVIAGMRAPVRVYLNASFNNFGNLTLASIEPLSDEHFDILLRFAKVFDLTYTRFNDLKQAEAQARESQIEAALERVRGKAMAMHNSHDVSAAASMVFTELRKLGIIPIRCGVGLLNKESRKAQLYSATSSLEGDSLSLVGWVQLSGHPVLANIYDTWLKNEEYYPELSGAQLQSYYELLLKGLSVTVPDSRSGQKQYGTFLPFSVGCLYAWSEAPYEEGEIKILKRFAAIIDLTFRRYIDLQKSEANAREAVKQAALDRVRADIASMRTIADLDRITPLIWNELTILGIPFIRCGVFIMDESQQFIHTFLSTPDGKAIAAFHLPYTTPGNIAQVLSHWQEKKNYIDHWDESAFNEFANILVKQGDFASAEQYLKTVPRGGFYLHFLPFLQGMLYVGNSTQLGEEEIKLIQSVADAFSTAYARYEDFNKLEAAKQQVEKTLVDLKQAQTQLVQSEKMASLGELTAGIAHEIQNPLNFVNNFSDVSSELLDEMTGELAKGNYKDAIDIANDVKQNLEKINHHGKRADGIVKGMLQHSRSSGGQKELTDINVLADEYLRLCYHGLRAKDKSFNATIKTDFDETIGKINIIPQDIGRVILNLLTNAFYAASLSRKAGFPDSDDKHDPTVWVSTKKIGNKVLISVRDNGPGIPPKVLDKIFQPFFTTKPTGQGTGLGLSLSYDIVKAHGGEIKVETKEGEGAAFFIVLPQ